MKNIDPRLADTRRAIKVLINFLKPVDCIAIIDDTDYTSRRSQRVALAISHDLGKARFASLGEIPIPVRRRRNAPKTTAIYTCDVPRKISGTRGWTAGNFGFTFTGGCYELLRSGLSGYLIHH